MANYIKKPKTILQKLIEGKTLYCFGHRKIEEIKLSNGILMKRVTHFYGEKGITSCWEDEDYLHFGSEWQIKRKGFNHEKTYRERP